jgi:hypothetical protein
LTEIHQAIKEDPVRFTTLAALLAGTILLAGCSSSSSSAPSAASGGGAGASGTASASGAATAAGAGEPSSPSVSGLDVSKSLQDQVTADFGKYPTVTGSTTQGVTSSTILIGIMGDITQGGNAIFPGLCQGAEARFKRANLTHELSRQILGGGCTDTGSDPSQAQSAENYYALSKRVFGMVNDSLLSDQSDAVFTQQHIPYIGWGVTPGFCGKSVPFGFGDSGAGVCNAVETQSNGKYRLINELQIGAYLRALNGTSPGKVRLAIVGDDSAISGQSVPQETRNARAAGVDVVYSGNSLPSNAAATANLDPYVAPILAARPTAVYNLSTHLPQLLGALKQAGYTGDIYQNSFIDGSALGTPQLGQLLNGTYGVDPGIGSPAFGGPDWATVQADAKAIGYTGGLTVAFLHSYIDADIWVQVLKGFQATGKPLTTENLTNFVNAGWTYTGFGNVASPISFPAGHYVGTSCASTVKLNATSKTAQPVADLSCAPAQIEQS